MSEIKLIKRIKYAGDVHAALMQLGWDAKTAAAFLDSIPDADAVEVVRGKDCKHWMKDVPGCTDNVGRCEWANYMVGAVGYCVYGERAADDGK